VVAKKVPDARTEAFPYLFFLFYLKVIYLLRTESQLHIDSYQFRDLTTQKAGSYHNNRNGNKADTPFFCDMMVTCYHSNISGTCGPVKNNIFIASRMDNDPVGTYHAVIEKITAQKAVQIIIIPCSLIKAIGIFQLIDTDKKCVRHLIVKVHLRICLDMQMNGIFLIRGLGNKRPVGRT